MNSRFLILMGVLLLSPKLGALEEAGRKIVGRDTAIQRKESPAEKFISFKNLKNGQQSDWFDYMKRVHDNKYDMLKQVHDDWTSYQEQNTRDWQNNVNCSAEQKDKIFTEQLDRALALYQRHMAQFKKLCDEERADAQRIQERHMEQLDVFLGKPIPKKAGPEKEPARPMPEEPTRVPVPAGRLA